MADSKTILEQQEIILKLYRNGVKQTEIGKQLGLSNRTVQRRLRGAEKRERLDPSLAQRLEEKGLTDYSALHSGWILEKNKDGSGSSLYFYLGQDEEKYSFVDAVKEVLNEIPKLSPITRPGLNALGKGYANWIFLADLHVGGEYGSETPQEEFTKAIDDIIARMPPAEHSVLCELGDLLDANDHKGVTPASGNPTDTVRDDHLGNTKTAIRLMKHSAYRLLQTHQTVELHLIRGNHDETAYFAVMLALEEHFAENPRIKIVVPKCPEEEEFRMVSWGKCAFFPHHGDKAKPNVLKDVWADQFPDEWAAAKSWRLIPTAHFHHLKAEDLGGAEWRQFRTIHRPNRWARMQGLFSYGSLCALTVHRERGLEFETTSNIRPMMKGQT